MAGSGGTVGRVRYKDAALALAIMLRSVMSRERALQAALSNGWNGVAEILRRRRR